MSMRSSAGTRFAGVLVSLMAGAAGAVAIAGPANAATPNGAVLNLISAEMAGDTLLWEAEYSCLSDTAVQLVIEAEDAPSQSPGGSAGGSLSSLSCPAAGAIATGQFNNQNPATDWSALIALQAELRSPTSLSLAATSGSLYTEEVPVLATTTLDVESVNSGGSLSVGGRYSCPPGAASVNFSGEASQAAAGSTATAGGWSVSLPCIGSSWTSWSELVAPTSGANQFSPWITTNTTMTVTFTAAGTSQEVFLTVSKQNPQPDCEYC